MAKKSRLSQYVHPQSQTGEEKENHGEQMLKARAEKRSIGRDEVLTLPLNLLRVHEDNIYNINDTEDAIAELRANIEKNGLLHNIDVTKRPGEKEYIILSGERRYKAYTYLFENAKRAGDKEKENKYRNIPCKEIFITVKDENLRKNAEQIYLDSANVFTRDGIQDPKIFEKVSVRYIQNLQLVDGMTAKEARRSLLNHLKETTGVDKTDTVDRSLSIYRTLIPELYRFYSSEQSDMTRDIAKKIGSLSYEEQKKILDCLTLLSKNKSVLGEKYSTFYKSLQSGVNNAISEGEGTGLIDATCQKIESDVNAVLLSVKENKKISQQKYNGPDGIFEKNFDTVLKAKTIVRKLGGTAVLGSLKDAHARGSDKDVLPQLDEMIEMLTKLKSEIEGGR